MTRRRLGAAAKTQVIALRVTEDEKKELESLFGSATKALQVIYAAWKEGRK